MKIFWFPPPPTLKGMGYPEGIYCIEVNQGVMIKRFMMQLCARSQAAKMDFKGTLMQI